MKSKIYYITYINEHGLTATKPYIATSEKRAKKMFARTNNKPPIKVSTDII